MKTRVAVVGLGAMGRGVVSVLRRMEDFEIVAAADIDPIQLEKTRPLLASKAVLTTDSRRVLDESPDVLVEATPTVIEAAQLVTEAIERKVSVVLMNGEVDQVFGRLLARKARENGVVLTSDAGDQHGVLARLISDIREMGFRLVLAGNNKGFLDRYANPDTIKEEAAKRRLSPRQCAAYTDGTKLAIEMAIVANAFDLSILETAMLGPKTRLVSDALRAFDLDRARDMGGVVDYVLGAQPGGSVFAIGYSEDEEDRFYMNYYKMGEGPYYLFVRPYHLCHFETPKAIRQVRGPKRPILVQRRRVLEVGCRAKTNLAEGTKLEGIGGHHLYGVLEHPQSLPIGLAEGVVLKKPKLANEAIAWDEVEFPREDPRLELWKEQAQLEN